MVFDAGFEQTLPSLLADTVRLSGGMQPIGRATLLYLYQRLARQHGSGAVILSGVSGDHFFRGHGNVPAIISAGMAQYFRSGETALQTAVYQDCFGPAADDFAHHIDTRLTQLRALYGEPTQPASFLSYLVYEVAPKYFGGEAAIANNYLTFRAPYWYTDLVALAYETQYSTLRYSKFRHRGPDPFGENVMQANVIRRNPRFAQLPINGIPLDVYASGNRALYQLVRLGVRSYERLTRSASAAAPLEDWHGWFQRSLKAEIERLLNDHSAITAYVTPQFINLVKRTNDTHWLSKLATAEILLQLIDNRWRLPTTEQRPKRHLKVTG